ncbi:MAG TPA: hypothetical protein VJS89_06775 [Gammaproteobacteria bacterium]|nr:hypothetical protein [Gammaproteobacteria bacterium]
MTASTRLKNKSAVLVRTIILLLGCVLTAVNGICQTQTKPDPNKEYFQQVNAAAVKGDLKAEVCLGSLYATGMGVPYDNQKAFEWYKKAAAQGFPPGIEAEAGAYQRGLGVTQNPKRALVMYHKLVDHGYLAAAIDIGVYYMSDDWGVRRDYAKAVQWYLKAAAAGDSMAEARMGMMYNGGWGVKRNPVQAAQWLSKAADHHISCMAKFMNLNFWIMVANLHLPNNIVGILQPFGIKYIYDGGRARDIAVLHSSGSRKLDDAYVNALRAAHFPPWPADYHTDDRTLGFWLMRSSVVSVGSDLASLIDVIYTAIGKAVFEPLHVLVYGSAGSGVAIVKFDYRNGVPSHIRIAQSSGDKYEDAAAIKAVESAHYPATPAAFKNHTMHLDIEIHFASVAPSATSSLQPLEPAAPPAATQSVSTAATSQAPKTAAAGSASQASASITPVGNTDLSDKTEKPDVKSERPPIQIVSTSWNDPNYIRPILIQVKFKNLSRKAINAIWLFVSKCAVKGSSEVIPYPLELHGSFEPGNSYSGNPTFPANYTEFTGYWPGIEGGRYSTHMLITKVDIWYADGAVESYGDDVSMLLGGGISNFCSTNYH